MESSSLFVARHIMVLLNYFYSVAPSAITADEIVAEQAQTYLHWATEVSVKAISKHPNWLSSRTLSEVLIILAAVKGFWDDFNLWIGTKISVFLSSMGGFWIILMLTIVPLLKDRPHGLIAWTMYVIQTIFQGAALPLLGYVADRGSKEVGKLIKEMHDLLLGRINERIDNIEKKVIEENAELKLLLKELQKSTRSRQ